MHDDSLPFLKQENHKLWTQREQEPSMDIIIGNFIMINLDDDKEIKKIDEEVCT